MPESRFGDVKSDLLRRKDKNDIELKGTKTTKYHTMENTCFGSKTRTDYFFA